jgi:menaquinol-cytochrome c reductase cytochrome b/c subunit
MSDSKDFEASFDSDSRRTPVRVAFVTRRTSPAVRRYDEDTVMTSPEALLRVGIAVIALLIVLVLVSLIWDAPLEGLADPLQTPNPAKAPWYFLGLQELLHYFPPVVAGVLIPTLVVLALIVIPYFGINIQAEGFWVTNPAKKLRALLAVVIALTFFLAWFQVWPVLVPTLAIAAAMYRSQRSGHWSRPLPFWIMTWFLIVAVALTLIGTFFRGAGWSWVWPWA